MRLLPLVARKRAVDRIEEDFENLRETVKGMEKGRAEADFEGWSGTVRDRMRALVDGAVEEGGARCAAPVHEQPLLENG